MKFELRKSIGFLLGLSYLGLTNKLTQRISESGIQITTEQWKVLNVLKNFGCMSQTELAVRLVKDTPAITRLIDGMEHKTWVERIADPADRRLKVIHITSQGEKVWEQVLPYAMETMQSLVDNYSEEEYEQLQQLLARMIKHLYGKSVEEMTARAEGCANTEKHLHLTKTKENLS